MFDFELLVGKALNNRLTSDEKDQLINYFLRLYNELELRRINYELVKTRNRINEC